MKHATGNQLVRSHWREGPLAAWLDAFADWVSAKGYAPSTAYRMILLAACFSQWLKQEAIEFADITSDHPAQYLRYRERELRPRQHDGTALRHFTDFLRREGVLSFEEALAGPMTDAERCVQAYEHYLQQTRGLSPATITNYLPFVRNFLQHRFAAGPVTLSSLSADDIVRSVQREARDLHPKRAKLMATALRSFLRYACYLGEASPELIAAVPAVAGWSMLQIPRGISPDQVQQLLASIDRSSAMGRRDYAILMLLARLGLRASEIQFLGLDNIDWINGTLRLSTKGGKRNTFPLSKEVGEAIADYLRHGRPQCRSRRIFLRVRAPIEGFRDSGGIQSVVRHAIERAGVVTPTLSTHQFRHGLATEMLRSGSSLAEIGDVLGHCHPDTTRIYAKVDLGALRALALPWPGGAQ